MDKCCCNCYRSIDADHQPTHTGRASPYPSLNEPTSGLDVDPLMLRRHPLFGVVLFPLSRAWVE